MPDTKAKPRRRAELVTSSDNDGDQFFRYFHIKRISDKTSIQPDKIYNNFKDFYKSLNPADKKKIARLMIPKAEEFFKRLGFAVTFEKIVETKEGENEGDILPDME